MHFKVKIIKHIKRSYRSPSCDSIEPIVLYKKLFTLSNLFWNVFLVSVFHFTPNQTPLKYRSPHFRGVGVTPVYLKVLAKTDYKIVLNEIFKKEEKCTSGTGPCLDLWTRKHWSWSCPDSTIIWQGKNMSNSSKTKLQLTKPEATWFLIHQNSQQAG